MRRRRNVQDMMDYYIPRNNALGGWVGEVGLEPFHVLARSGAWFGIDIYIYIYIFGGLQPELENIIYLGRYRFQVCIGGGPLNDAPCSMNLFNQATCPRCEIVGRRLARCRNMYLPPPLRFPNDAPLQSNCLQESDKSTIKIR